MEPRLTSDEEIQRARLGTVTPHDGPITLAVYHPAWPTLFEREAGHPLACPCGCPYG